MQTSDLPVLLLLTAGSEATEAAPLLASLPSRLFTVFASCLYRHTQWPVVSESRQYLGGKHLGRASESLNPKP